MAAGGRPSQWRPTSLRASEALRLGPSAARRAARRRAQVACEAAVARRPGRPAAGSWQDREAASRPALRLASAGRRVPGAARYRRNAAWHAADAPEVGFASAPMAEIQASAAGPRLGWSGPPGARASAEVLTPLEEMAGSESAAAWIGSAPGTWLLEDVSAAASAFADGIEAGWRLAEASPPCDVGSLLRALGQAPAVCDGDSEFDGKDSCGAVCNVAADRSDRTVSDEGDGLCAPAGGGPILGDPLVRFHCDPGLVPQEEYWECVAMPSTATAGLPWSCIGVHALEYAKLIGDQRLTCLNCFLLMDGLDEDPESLFGCSECGVVFCETCAPAGWQKWALADEWEDSSSSS